VATFTKQKPLNILYSFGSAKFDTEGRAIITEYPEFTLCNVYFPNGKQGDERLKYKLDFYNEFFNYLEPRHLRGDKIIICGDVNTAHQEIDLARPQENSKISGFLPVERAWLDKLLSSGYTDTFRHFHQEPGQYTWWDMKTGARERNVGWRIDYFFVTENLLGNVMKAYIMPDITGSDHCPIALILKLR
jgi:exodeoxyribonuclease-3